MKISISIYKKCFKTQETCVRVFSRDHCVCVLVRSTGKYLANIWLHTLPCCAPRRATHYLAMRWGRFSSRCGAVTCAPAQKKMTCEHWTDVCAQPGWCACGGPSYPYSQLCVRLRTASPTISNDCESLRLSSINSKSEHRRFTLLKLHTRDKFTKPSSSR